MKNTDIYKRVLDGNITPNIAKEYLSSGTKKNCEEIVVFPSQIIKILNLYLTNDISAEELSKWASFLVASDAYVCPNWEDDEKAEKYEPMWYILQQLSSPELDGEITQEGIREHLQILNKI